MTGCNVDTTLTRARVGDMSFPLGAYPVEEMTPRAGYTMTFEPADGDEDSGDWEEWPDRYVFDIAITSERVEPLVRHLLSFMPGRVYPILDVMGRDAYREIDPFVSYELVGLDRFLDTLRRFRGFFFEDGLVGFGAMSEDPFYYAFVDEHKIVTVRCTVEWKERVESVLKAFDLEEVEEIAGADAAAHEHRSVIVAPDDHPELLTFDEILEELRDEWALVLNVDPDSNQDDEGNDLGVTCWRVLVRADFDQDPVVRYIEVLLRATCLGEAEGLARDASDQLFTKADPEPTQAVIVESDRLIAEDFVKALQDAGRANPVISPEPEVELARWIP